MTKEEIKELESLSAYRYQSGDYCRLLEEWLELPLPVIQKIERLGFLKGKKEEHDKVIELIKGFQWKRYVNGIPLDPEGINVDNEYLLKEILEKLQS